jgi:hydroxymethylglutaryl-CoA lyase
MLNGLGIRTGVDLEKLLEASAFIEPKVGHPLPARFYRAARSQ